MPGPACSEVFNLTGTADATVARSPNGTIYQASNAMFGGRARAQYVWITREGQVLSRRSLNKITNQEVGHAYAARQLIAAGAPPREILEEPRDWVARVLPLIATRVKHPGNFVFAFGLDGPAREQVRQVLGGQPYPRVQLAPESEFESECDMLAPAI